MLTEDPNSLNKEREKLDQLPSHVQIQEEREPTDEELKAIEFGEFDYL